MKKKIGNWKTIRIFQTRKPIRFNGCTLQDLKPKETSKNTTKT
jgi:hypothetical protein